MTARADSDLLLPGVLLVGLGVVLAADAFGKPAEGNALEGNVSKGKAGGIALVSLLAGGALVATAVS